MTTPWPDLTPAESLDDLQNRLDRWDARDVPVPQDPRAFDPVSQAIVWLARSFIEVEREGDPVSPRRARGYWQQLLRRLPRPLGVRWMPEAFVDDTRCWWPSPAGGQAGQALALWTGLVQMLDRIEDAQGLLRAGLRLPPDSGALHHFMLVASPPDRVARDWRALRRAGADPQEPYGLPFERGVGTLAHCAVDIALNQVFEVQARALAILALAHADGLELSRTCPVGSDYREQTAETWASHETDPEVQRVFEWLRGQRQQQALLEVLSPTDNETVSLRVRL